MHAGGVREGTIVIMTIPIIRMIGEDIIVRTIIEETRITTPRKILRQMSNRMFRAITKTRTIRISSRITMCNRLHPMLRSHSKGSKCRCG